MDAPSLQAFKARLDVALGSLVCWLVTLHMAGGWNWMSIVVLCNPGLWFYDSVTCGHPLLVAARAPCGSQNSSCFGKAGAEHTAEVMICAPALPSSSIGPCLQPASPPSLPLAAPAQLTAGGAAGLGGTSPSSVGRAGSAVAPHRTRSLCPAPAGLVAAA